MYEYELVYDGQGGDGSAFLMGLSDLTAPDNTATTPSSRGQTTHLAGEVRPHNGPIAGPLRGELIERQANTGAGLQAIEADTMPNARPGPHTPQRSYPQASSLAAVPVSTMALAN